MGLYISMLFCEKLISGAFLSPPGSSTFTLSHRVSLLSPLTFRCSLSLFFSRGLTHRGGGAQNQPGRTDRARDGERGRESELGPLSLWQPEKGKSSPGKGRTRKMEKRGRDRKREIRENYTEAMEEKNCHKSTLPSSQLDLLDPHATCTVRDDKIHSVWGVGAILDAYLTFQLFFLVFQVEIFPVALILTPSILHTMSLGDSQTPAY